MSRRWAGALGVAIAAVVIVALAPWRRAPEAAPIAPDEGPRAESDVLAPAMSAVKLPPSAWPIPPRPPEITPAVRPAGDLETSARARVEKMTREYLDAMRVPPTVAAEAKTLGVAPEALRAMYRAEFLVYGRRQTPADVGLGQAADDSLAALAALGDEGFRAVAANARGNPENGSAVDVLAKAAWSEGREASLIEWLRAAPSYRTVVAPLRLLGGIDTPEVRKFLRGALETYADHASNFVAAAASLAALRDVEAVGPIGKKLREDSWSGVRDSLLESLGKIGGAGAREALVDYVRDAKTASKVSALTALAVIDPAAADAEARALLARTGSDAIKPAEADRVRRFLDR